MRVAVYNLYWTTFGGGEQMAGAAVDALSAEHDVTLLGAEPLDLDEARERLGLRLDGVTFRCVPPDGYAATLASADYDLFVNHTYRSTAPSLAPYGVYFVMFPHQLESPRSRQLLQRAGRSLAGSVRLLGGVGMRDGVAIIDGPVMVQVPATAKELRAVLRSNDGEEVMAVQVRAGADGRRHHVDASGAEIGVDLVAGAGGTHLGQVLLSPLTLAAERHHEQRLELAELWVDGQQVSVSPHSLRQRLVPPRHADFLPTYQRVIANSEYTRGWTQRWWGRGEGVISPPVRMRRAGEKEQLIVSVGRFFGEDSGHSKRQLDLVGAFRAMVEEGLTGWRLVLIGGCSAKDRDYAMAVRREAAGLPVEVRLNAPGAVVDAHLAAASIYWHGAGYGSDLDQHPDRAEHFGIAPIEAMSAGAVPLVFDAGGPAAVVRDGVDGMRWHTLEQLAARTRRLVDDAALRSGMGVAAVERAREFDVHHCEQHVRDLVAELVADQPASGRATDG